MICPQTWNLREKRSVFCKFNGNTDDYLKTDKNIICKERLNHVISVVIPDTPTIPETIRDVLLDTDYYRLDNINLSQFLNTEFIKCFVKKGKLWATSIENNLNTNDCFSIADGLLTLSLTKETFQCLGIEGMPYSRHKKRYRVEINLQDTRLNKKHQQIVDSLKNRLKPFNAIINWEPHEENICASTVAAYFSSLKKDVYKCEPKFESRVDYNVTIPLLDRESDLSEMYEWLGVFSIGGDLTKEINEYISTYACPEPSQDCGSALFLKWSGFFTSKSILRLCSELTNFLQTRQMVPWISLYVQPFRDSPDTWIKNKYQFTENEQSSYTIFFEKMGNYHMCYQANAM